MLSAEFGSAFPDRESGVLNQARRRERNKKPRSQRLRGSLFQHSNSDQLGANHPGPSEGLLLLFLDGTEFVDHDITVYLTNGAVSSENFQTNRNESTKPTRFQLTGRVCL